MRLISTAAWRSAFPGAAVGLVMLTGVSNPPMHPALRAYAREVESRIRARFEGASRQDLAAVPVLQAYRSYYKRFDKTYHVQLQLESLVFKGKPLTSHAALVEAMFATELEHLLLTAGHDLDAVQGPITVDVSTGSEGYVGIAGRQLTLKPGDMYMRDGVGILSSVLYGPDQRTRLTADTRRAAFTVYAPVGIGPAAVRRHLEDLAAAVQVFAPEAQVEALYILTAP